MNRQFKYCTFLYSLLTLFTASISNAQNTSALGRFEVDVIRGCAPLSIQVTDNSGSGVSVFQYEGSASTQTNLLNYTYTTPGTYVLIQTIQNLVPRQDSLIIEVFDPIPPDFTVLTCENEGVSVQINDANYEQFMIDYGDLNAVTVNRADPVPTHFYAAPGTYTITVRGLYNNAADNCAQNTQQVQTISTISPASLQSLYMLPNDRIALNYTLPQSIFYDLEIAVNGSSTFQKLKDISNTSSTDTISGLDLNQRYCFRVTSFDPCTNNTIASNVVCTVDLGLNIANNVNQLSWNTLTGGISNFTVNRDGQPLSTVANSLSQFADNNITCNTNYCYQLVVNYTSGGMSFSRELCGISISTDAPSAVNNLSVSVNGDQYELDWSAPVGFVPVDYFVGRSASLVVTDNIDTVQTNSYIDNSIAASPGQLCYAVSYQDQCLNNSPRSIVACSILLAGFEALDGSIRLNWTTYDGWANGVLNYRLDAFDESMNLLETIDAGTNNAFQDLDGQTVQIVYYQVTAQPVDGSLPAVQSNLLKIVAEPKVFFPKAFTPDGDDLNDEFMGFGKFIDGFSLKVFNKWGELVFASENIDVGWDGRVNGKLAPPGSYLYVADIDDFEGNRISKSGSIILLR